MTEAISYALVDAFAAQAFGGNPAGVCLLAQPAAAGWMQAVAAEMNLSETAFVAPRAAGGWDLRWFTPTVEVSLCGHATLASAHVLWESGRLAPDAEARFLTLSGWLVCRRAGDAIVMDFPALPVTPRPAPAGLLEALGVSAPVFVGGDGLDYLVHLDAAAAVRGLTPDLPRLALVEARGVIVTARSADPAYDFVSRFFAPRAGVNEDPVTGSAHCALGPYWQGLLGQSTLRAWQCSGRGGAVLVEVRGARVLLSGRAVTILTGTLAPGALPAAPATAATAAGLVLSADPRLLDVALIHTWLSQQSYWARGRTLEDVRRSIAHSRCFGAYDQGRQVAFARVVTDATTFAWLADFFVAAPRRRQGIGRRLLAFIVAQPELATVERFALATQDAHGFYAKYGGFRPLAQPENCLQRPPAPPAVAP